jgi:hypothetical protein
LKTLEDPAGLDKLLLAAAHSGVEYIEAYAAQHGIKVDLWNGPNGAEEVLMQAIEEHRVPNQRFAALVTPRSVAEGLGLIKKKRSRKRLRDK